jgi:hypothetical protein
MQGKGLARAEELALVLAALDEAAGPGAHFVSLSIEAAQTSAGAANATARVTRASRTLTFLEADVQDAEGRRTLTASAVYRIAQG